MKIDDQFRKCVGFVVTGSDDPDGRRAIGTGFFAGIDAVEFGAEKGLYVYAYVVTVRHVAAARHRSPIFLRVNLKTGGRADIPLPDEGWSDHHSLDAAICDFPGLLEAYDAMAVPSDVFADDDYIAAREMAEGASVFFSGLFAAHPGTERNQPIIRFGRISLMPGEPITVKTPEGSFTNQAYLVEATSWPGQSGSPSFTNLELDETFLDSRPGAPGIALLGVVQGHFDSPVNVSFLGDVDGSAAVEVNNGIASVVPASAILELFALEENVAARKAAFGRQFGDSE